MMMRDTVFVLSEAANQARVDASIAAMVDRLKSQPKADILEVWIAIRSAKCV
jgi:acetaldehyde dehydrogenase (acetylating)